MVLTQMLVKGHHYCQRMWWWCHSADTLGFPARLWPVGHTPHCCKPPSLTPPQSGCPQVSQRWVWTNTEHWTGKKEQFIWTFCCSIFNKTVFNCTSCQYKAVTSVSHLKSSAAALGIIPCWVSCGIPTFSPWQKDPIMVWVFPLPVCPYAIMQTL